ncbi:hypothetical protein GZ77_17540 [Endozoicomonas montiporae]|uniref:Outer membrane protein beta-barrel domain-containing protein n=2 Tax=Endozoicomonas montiporae TaxID=1027273 RepID=A0A081N1N1_9GAMM|nr:acyloxyacyl hydrolase [Endozoicomonas montiporae]AMO58712.1 lipid A 3-O-deacylase [Endozoicomonas montiporae CL-33]KEQ12354.1 hypothetical protein GZ77_17540 [Endozoicomonas montiporae]
MKKGFFYAGMMSLLPFPASALDIRPDGLSASYGQYLPVVSGRKANYDHYRIGIQWDWGDELYRSDSLVMSGYFELGGSALKSRLNASDSPSPEGKDKATVVSFSPVFRFSSAHPLFGNAFPFLDAGVGGAWFSEKDLEKEKKSPINMGSHWLFEVRLGAGFTFGEGQRYSVSYGWLHYSNGGLARLNESIDFHSVSFAYRW